MTKTQRAKNASKKAPLTALAQRAARRREREGRAATAANASMAAAKRMRQMEKDQILKAERLKTFASLVLSQDQAFGDNTVLSAAKLSRYAGQMAMASTISLPLEGIKEMARFVLICMADKP